MNHKNRKRLVFLSLLFVLTGILAFWTNLESSKTTSFKQPSSSISFSDTTSISEIIILANGKEKILKKNNRQWLLNNQFLVRNQLITLLLFAFNKMEIKRPVDNNSSQVIDFIKKENILVTVKEGGKDHKFYIASNPNDINSSYYWNPESKEPLIVYVPGVKGEISNLLKLDFHEWRSRDIFKSSIRSLESISVNYNDKKQEGFDVIYDSGTFKIPGVENVDSVKLKKYLSLFSILGGEQYITADSTLEKLKKEQPAAEISVKDIDEKKSNTLKIFFLEQKLYGELVKQKETMLLNPQIFKYVLIDKKYFEQKKKS